MRYLLTTALLFALSSSAMAADGGVVWKSMPPDAAFAAAKTAGQPLFIDVFAEWCGPCHELDAKVFVRPDVQAALADTLTLRVDAESPEGKALVERFHVVGYPTLLLVGPDGVEIDRLFGYVEADELIRRVGDYRQGKGTLADLETQLQKAGKDADAKLVAEVFERSAVRGKRAQAEALLERVLALDPTNEGGRASSALFTAGRYLYLRGAKAYDRAIATFVELRARFPKSKEAASALIEMANAKHKKGDDAAARKDLDAFIATAPGVSGTYNRVAWFCFKEDFDLAYGAQVALQGVAVEPKDAGLWDTLAELRFKSGDAAGAVAAIERAIAADPAEKYYERQKAKFTAGAAKGK